MLINVGYFPGMATESETLQDKTKEKSLLTSKGLEVITWVLFAGKLNDNADKTAPVISYWPNEYGLYNMAGNVSEWVMDVYRPMVDPNTSDLNPFRGNVFET